METTICIDHLGNKHEVPTAELIKRHSAYGIVIHENRVLLVHEVHTDRWEFPGGGIDEGENVIEGMKREVFEETGIQVEGETVLVRDVHEYFFNLPSNEGWDSTRSFYVVRGDISGDLFTTGNNDDTLGAAFVVFDEAKKRVTNQILSDLLAEALMTVKK